MSYLVIKNLGHNFYLGKNSLKESKNSYVVFKSNKEIVIGQESYTYDETSNKLLWEGIEDLGFIIVGFANTEEEALDLAF